MDIQAQIEHIEENLGQALAEMKRLHANEPYIFQFGTWSSWGQEHIRFLLEELRDGHWNDCGDTVPGFALATTALNLVLGLDFGELEDRDRQVFRGIRELATTLQDFSESEDATLLSTQIDQLVTNFLANEEAKQRDDQLRNLTQGTLH